MTEPTSAFDRMMDRANDTVRERDELREKLSKALASVRELEAVVRLSNAAELIDILTNLASAADHLLRDHDCDRHGHERIGLDAQSAQQIAAKLTSALAKAKETGK